MGTRKRQHSDPQRSARKVDFVKGLEEGPSGSGTTKAHKKAHKKALANPSFASESGSESESMDIDQSQQQLQHELEESTDYQDRKAYWDALPPTGRGSLLKLDDPEKDIRVTQGLVYLIAEIAEYAKEKVAGVSSKSFMDRLLADKHNEWLIRYIGRIAMGGPKGMAGWNVLLTDQTCRQALLIGMVGHALEEKVFSELYFGGDPALTESLEKRQRAEVNEEGKRAFRSIATVISAKSRRRLLPHGNASDGDPQRQVKSQAVEFRGRCGDCRMSAVKNAGTVWDKRHTIGRKAVEYCLACWSTQSVDAHSLR